MGNYEIHYNQSKVGILSVLSGDVFSFQYFADWLENGFSLGKHFPIEYGMQKHFFNSLVGVFADMAPDRWGRNLIRKKLNLENKKITESSFLLELSDETRLGALRIYDAQNKEYLGREKTIPHLTSLNELMAAAKDVVNNPNKKLNRGVNTLFYPGSSLGGAHPKANVFDNKTGKTYIAKFDTENNKSSIYEYEYNQLLSNLGFNVPNMKLVGRDILLSERFDRLTDERLFYLSAMSMIGADEANKSDCDLSYLNIAFSFDEQFGDKMLVVANEIWKRALANVLLGNTDDHLRNHAFLRVNGQFVMSPMFDVTPCLYNPNIHNREHVLSIVDGGERTPIKMMEDLIGFSEYFGIDKLQAEQQIKTMMSAINNYKFKNLSKSEQEELRENVFCFKEYGIDFQLQPIFQVKRRK